MELDRVTRSRIKKRRRRWILLGTMTCALIFIGGFIMADLSLASMNGTQAGSAAVFGDISQRLQDTRIWDKLSSILNALWQHISS